MVWEKGGLSISVILNGIRSARLFTLSATIMLAGFRAKIGGVLRDAASTAHGGLRTVTSGASKGKIAP